ncbi:hypothetical protein IXO704_015860 [Xanthomonas oryzae pv. oryzae]|nr:hypothetical protein IXO704_015860 [Xanthomonas oryzae pv. oryzae]
MAVFYTNPLPTLYSGAGVKCGYQWWIARGSPTERVWSGVHVGHEVHGAGEALSVGAMPLHPYNPGASSLGTV